MAENSNGGMCKIIVSMDELMNITLSLIETHKKAISIAYFQRIKEFCRMSKMTKIAQDFTQSAIKILHHLTS